MTLHVSRVMAENQEIDLDAWQKLDLLHDEASNEGMRAIRYFAHRLHEAQSNPHLWVAVQAQLRSNNFLPPAPEEGIYSLEHQETLALGRRNSTHEELKSPLQQRKENDDPSNGYEDHEDGSEEDHRRLSDQEMPPRRRRPKCSPIRSMKQGRASSRYGTSSSSDGSSERRNPRQRRRRSPSPPSSSPNSSSYNATRSYILSTTLLGKRA